MTSQPEAASTLRKLAKNRRFEELETACVEAIENTDLAPDDLLSVLRVAAHRATEEQTETIVWLALSSWAERHGAESGFALAAAGADVLPGSDLVREEIASLAHEAREDYPELDDLCGQTVLAARVPLEEGVRRLDALLRLPPGSYVREPGKRDAGRVRGPAGGGTEIEIEFADGMRSFTLDRAAKLIFLDPDDFSALAVFEKDRLAVLGAEDPGALVEMVLRAKGGEVAYRDLRGALADVVSESWTTWWNAARPSVRRSSWIEISAGNQPTLRLRHRPLTHAERVRRELDEAETGFDRLGAVLDYLAEVGDHLAEEAELVRGIAEALDPQVQGDDAALALASLAAMEEVRRVAPEALSGGELPTEPFEGDVGALLYRVPDPRLERLVLALLRERRTEDWPELYAEALPGCSAEVCEWGAQELEVAGYGEWLADVAEAVMEHPVSHPGSLVWLWKSAAAGRMPEACADLDRGKLLAHFLGAVDRSSRVEDDGGASFGRLRAILATKNYAGVRTVMEGVDMESARRTIAALKRSIGLPELARARVTDVLAETHPDLFYEEKAPWERDDVIYTTAAGLEKKQAEYDRMVNDRLPEIAQAIGKAAAFGDLSENAEYTAALEERERMTERANSLHADLRKAKTITPDMTRGPRVGIGSEVEARNAESDETETFRFLGPWDGDVEQRVFYYRAPFAAGFMGLTAGDVAVVKKGDVEERWKILEVRSAVR